MTANTTPIFTLTPNTPTGKTVTTANTAKDGTGTIVSIFTAGANGSHVNKVVFQPTGTAVATAARVFLNNGLTNATAANNTYLADITLAAATLSEVASMPQTVLTLNIDIPAGYVLNVTIGTTVAAPYAVTAVGGDY